MEKLLGFVTGRFSEELLIQLFDVGIVVGAAPEARLIVVIETGGALDAQFIGCAVGLASAANAAAWAGHHFNKVIGSLLARRLGRADLVDDLLDIGQTVSHGDSHRLAGHFDGAFLDAGQAARNLEIDTRSIFASDEVAGRAQSRFHDAACGAEDGAGTGVCAQNAVGLLVWNGDKIDAGLLDHAGKLARCQRDIHILKTGGAHLLAADDLGLLGRAGHDGDHENLGWIDPLFFRIVGLGQRADHGVRRLATGEVLDHVAVEFFHEIDPTGAATGNQGQLAFAIEKARLELGGFFHDGQIGAEVGVEDGLEAHAAQRGVDLAGEVLADGEAEGLADGDADGRSDLSNAEGIRVCKLIPNGNRFIVLGDGSGGAVRRALAAADAGRVGQRNIAGGGNARIEAAIEKAERPHILILLADLNAAPAEDALAGIEHNAVRGIVQREVRNDVIEAAAGQAEVGGEILQLAVLIAQAGEALVGMAGERQLEHGAADLNNLRRLGEDLHVVFDGSATGTHHSAVALVLDDANAAGRGGIQIGMLAERGYLYVNLACGFQNGCTGLDVNGQPVNPGLNFLGHGSFFSIPVHWALVLSPLDQSLD